MPTATLPSRIAYVHPDDPANNIKPGEPFVVDGLDWSWAFCEFRPARGFPGYCVGSNGTVWTAWERIYVQGIEGCSMVIGDRWVCLKTNVSSDHLFLAPFRDGKRYQRFVHRLVLEAFVGERPEGYVCCHYDDDPSNNRLRNLRWDTQKANAADAIRNNRKAIGEDHHASVLTEAAIIEIREAFAAGTVSQRELAEIYGVKQVNISAIVTGSGWAHVGGPITHRGRNPIRMTEDKSNIIMGLLENGVSQRAIARQLGMSKGTVRLVVKGHYDTAR